jgi:phage baseplate assembly protein W
MISKYIDIPYNLTSGATLVKDEEMLLQKIQLLLTTEPGDFINIPKWGTPLKQYLYEQLTSDTRQFVKMAVENSLRTWMGDHVTILSILVDTNYEDHSITVQLNLYLKEFSKQLEFVVNRKTT